MRRPINVLGDRLLNVFLGDKR